MKYTFLVLIRLYQHTFSHIFRFFGAECRFYPSCSEYSRQAFEKHRFIKGFGLSVRRISRCHPWGGSGIDEIPE
jgi:putative membrane protein insertion efficiency factor